ncbi:MAG: T9SS type A sorting domain-containing protein, partial [bacterium]
KITFDLPKTSEVKLNVYNITGKLVTTLIDKKMAAGKHSLIWHVPRVLASGVYFVKLETEGFSSVKKMTFLK